MNQGSLIYLYVALYLIGGSSSLSGQSCDFSLSGKVVDLHDGTPIFGALVSVGGTTFFNQSDENGFFQIKGLCLGAFDLIVEHPECPTLKRQINFKGDQFINLELEHHINELDEIILSDTKLKEINATVKEMRLDKDQISQFSSKSLAEALNTLPGVSALKTGVAIAKPMIHGFYGSRVGIVANGVRLRDQEWGADHAPNIDFNSFESVQVVKGAVGLKYGGDTAGGIIVLAPAKTILKDSLYGMTTLNLESNGRGTSVTTQLSQSYLKGYYWSAHLTGKRFGDFQAPNYNLSNSGFTEGNLAIKIGRTKIVRGWELNYSRFQNEAGILRAAHIGNIQDLFTALNSEAPLRIKPFTYAIEAPKQRGTHQNLQFSFYKTLQNNAKLELKYSYQVNQRKEFDVRRGARSELPAIDLTLQSQTFLGSYSWKKGFDWSFETGVNGLLEDNFSNPDTGVKRLIPDYIKYEWGTFLVGTFQPSTRFSWDWGLRADSVFIDAQKYYNLTNWKESGYSVFYPEFERQIMGTQILTNPRFRFFNWAAQTGIGVSLGSDIDSRFAYVLSQRAPNSSELFSDGLHHSIAALEYGNLILRNETSHKILMSITRRTKNFSLSLEPYFSKVFDYIFIEPTALEQTIRGAFPVWRYRSTDAFFAGLDFNSNLTISKYLNIDMGASYTYAQDQLNQNPLILIPPFSMFQKLKYSPDKASWNLEIIHDYYGKQNRYPNSNFQFNLIENGSMVSKTVNISESPAGFQKFDAIFSLQLKEKHKMKKKLRFIVQNLANAEYRNYLNRMRFYASEIGRNFQLQFILNY